MANSLSLAEDIEYAVDLSDREFDDLVEEADKVHFKTSMVDC
jgi:hypothetical protein